MTPARAVELVAKLLRTAAPDSGASEPERGIAALEAAKLISEHKLIVALPLVLKARVVRPQASRSSIFDAVMQATENISRGFNARAPHPSVHTTVEDITEDQFVPWDAMRDETCAEESCGEKIYRDEKVWRRIKNGREEYVHADCWTL